MVYHKQLVDKLDKLKVPCIVCRSKSGGAHIFFFFDKWMEAADFRDKAAEIAAALGHGRCEIFPKQEQVLVERGDVGNFINLPYFDAEKTLRFGIWKEKSKFVEATLKQFIDRVHKTKCDPKKFMDISVGGKDTFKFVNFGKKELKEFYNSLDNIKIRNYQVAIYVNLLQSQTHRHS